MYFEFLAILNALSHNTLSRAVLLFKTFKIFISHIMLKTRFIQFLLINIFWISCFFKLNYPLFIFIFSEWCTSAIDAETVLNAFLAWFYLLLIKLCLLLHSFHTFKNKIFAMGKSLKIEALIPTSLINNPLVSFSLINFDFLLPHAAHFHKKHHFTSNIFSTLQTTR